MLLCSKPVWFALVYNLLGLHIYFACPSDGTEDFVHFISTFLFTLGLAVLMAFGDFVICFPPRPAPWPLHGILQFFGAVFVIEIVQHTVWYPIVSNILVTLPTWADSLDECCEENGGVICCSLVMLFDILQYSCFSQVLVVVMAQIFLMCCLHTTQLVDIRDIGKKGALVTLDSVNLL